MKLLQGCNMWLYRAHGFLPEQLWESESSDAPALPRQGSKPNNAKLMFSVLRHLVGYQHLVQVGFEEVYTNICISIGILGTIVKLVHYHSSQYEEKVMAMEKVMENVQMGWVCYIAIWYKNSRTIFELNHVKLILLYRY